MRCLLYWPLQVTALESAAHESYLVSKNSFVIIDVSKFPRVRRRFESFCLRVPGKMHPTSVLMSFRTFKALGSEICGSHLGVTLLEEATVDNLLFSQCLSCPTNYKTLFYNVSNTTVDLWWLHQYGRHLLKFKGRHFDFSARDKKR